MEKFLSLSEEKQTTILNAALQCFGKYGYEKTSINDIATAAHISKASIFQYFGNKKQLYAYLLQYCGTCMIQALNQDTLGEQHDLFDRILEAGHMKIAQLQKYPFIAPFVSTAWVETAPEVQDLLLPLYSWADKFREDLILHEEDAIKFKNPDDASLVFQILMLMSEGYAARYLKAEMTSFDTFMNEFQQIVTMLRNNFYKEEFL